MEALHGVTIVCWLGGTVEIPEGRLRMFFEKLVDTPVRGVVYEGPFEDAGAHELGDVADPPGDRHSCSRRQGRRGPTSRRLSRSVRMREVAPQTMWPSTS